METEKKFSEKPEGVFGFNVKGNSGIVLNMEGEFRIPKDFQDRDGELSVVKIQELTSKGMTNYSYSRYPSLNSDGEYQERFSMTWRH